MGQAKRVNSSWTKGFHRMDEKCSVRASGAKKELVLEGFQPMEEWAEKVLLKRFSGVGHTKKYS